MKSVLTMICAAVFLLSAVYAAAKESVPDGESKIVIMREVTVQGEFDNPAFIIVPKARIYKKDLFKKSYYNDIVRSIYYGPVKRGTDGRVRKENRKRR